jgi:hypothetical protein
MKNIFMKVGTWKEKGMYGTVDEYTVSIALLNSSFISHYPLLIFLAPARPLFQKDGKQERNLQRYKVQPVNIIYRKPVLPAVVKK